MAHVTAQFSAPFDDGGDDDNNVDVDGRRQQQQQQIPQPPLPRSTSGTLRASLHSGPQLRAFKSSLQFLSKIGAELLVEAFPDRLVLRAINPSRSAFGAVTLRAGSGVAAAGDNNRRASFAPFSGAGGFGAFASFDVFDAAVVRVGVPAKHLLAALRGGGGGGGAAGAAGTTSSSSSSSSTTSHSSKPARLALELCPGENVLRAHVVSESLLSKRYEFSVSGDAEILQAAVDAAALPAGFVASPSGLNAALGASTFSGSGGGGGGGGRGGGGGTGGSTAGGEVTVVITTDERSGAHVVELRSYSDAGTDDSGAPSAAAAAAAAARPAKAPVRTTLRLDAAASLRDVRLPVSNSSSLVAPSCPGFVDVTLSARDLRSVLPLCESLGADAAFRAAGPGAPVLVEAVPRPAGAGAGGRGGAAGGGNGDDAFDLVGSTTSHEGMLSFVEAQLVLATLAESAIEPPRTPPQASHHHHHHHYHHHHQQQQTRRPPAPPPAPAVSAAASSRPPARGGAAAAAPAANFEDDDADDEAFLGSMAAAEEAAAAAAAARRSRGGGGEGGGAGAAVIYSDDGGDDGDGDVVAGTPPEQRPGW